MSDNSHYVGEAERIVREAQEQGITLRILGSTAFRIHTPNHVAIHTAMERPMTDIDLLAYSKQDREIDRFFIQTGFEPLRAALTPELFAHRRIYNHPNGLHVDIFLDHLHFCHQISFKDRLHVDTPTIPLAELALEKLQIVHLNEKDVKDMLILLAGHPVGDHDNETINGAYIAATLSRDWGFYYTTTLNLVKIRNGLGRYRDLFSAADIQSIETGLSELGRRIEEAPKSMGWKARAAVGPRLKWYQEVDEVERAEHLKDED